MSTFSVNLTIFFEGTFGWRDPGERAGEGRGGLMGNRMYHRIPSLFG